MKQNIAYLSIIVAFTVASCLGESKKNETHTDIEKKSEHPMEEDQLSKADSLIRIAIKAHGGELYDTAFYAFTFRNKRYSFKNNNGSFTYTMTRTENGDTLRYTLESGAPLAHTLNGSATELSKKDIAKYTEDVNSVIYFATLPYKLADKAVNSVYKGQTSMKGKNYDMVGITFDRIGGGEDHNDEFLYWINKETSTMDYMAYKYETNDGGVRFRSAYDPRTIDGIRFQDYVNYEAPLGTPLIELPKLFENGKLKELSRIETENVVNLKEQDL